MLHCCLFKNKESQGTTADTFQVKRKKFYQAVSGKTYDTGKKLSKAEKLEKEQKKAAAKLAKLTGKKPKTEPNTIRGQSSMDVNPQQQRHAAVSKR